ncbi:MAG: hypothetical protein JWQ57_3654 [Mucilaginibacter sp.]|nr:hypothetical protein [Mucilaginibacter sp.]
MFELNEFSRVIKYKQYSLNLNMATQFITNEKGKKTAVIIPISEYENLLHQHHIDLELTDEYKKMIDGMLDDETAGKAEYVSFESIKYRFNSAPLKSRSL